MKTVYDIQGGFYVEFKEDTKLVAKLIAMRAVKHGRYKGKIDLRTRRIVPDDFYLTRTEAVICMLFGLDYNSVKETTVEVRDF